MNQYSPKFKEFDEPAIYDHEDDMDDLETKPLKLGKKRKYNKNKNKIKDTLKKRRPNVKDVPPDMKIAMADEEGICESRRRVYCDICTKGNDKPQILVVCLFVTEEILYGITAVSDQGS